MQQANSENRKPNSFILEVCVDSIQSAIAAEKGRAERIELCSSLSEGGITPSAGMIAATRDAIGIGLHVLLRPRRGDFLYSPLEFEIIKKDIETAKKLGAEGIVVGLLKADGQIDRERMKVLMELSQPLNITFHRAFDLTPDPYQALDELIRLGVHRLLTSGQQESAYKGMALIADLVKRADDQLTVMPGGGINSQNIQELIEKTAAREFHASARKKVKSSMHFRRSDLPMAGSQPLSEYEQLVADPDQVRAIRKAFGGPGALLS